MAKSKAESKTDTNKKMIKLYLDNDEFPMLSKFNDATLDGICHDIFKKGYQSYFPTDIEVNDVNKSSRHNPFLLMFAKMLVEKLPNHIECLLRFREVNVGGKSVHHSFPHVQFRIYPSLDQLRMCVDGRTELKVARARNQQSRRELREHLRRECGSYQRISNRGG